MPRMLEFAREDKLPSYFVNVLQDFLSGARTDLRLSKLDNTHVQVVPAEPYGIAAIDLEGRWRWIDETISRAHPGGAAGTYSIWAVATDQDVDNVPKTFSDHTDYDFDLRITKGVEAPAGEGVEVFEKIGEVEWDGAKITQLKQTYNAVPGAMIEAAALSNSGDIEWTRDSSGAMVASYKADSIGTGDIGPEGVGTSELVDLAVVTAKVAALAITEGKLAENSVATAKIVALAVTAAKLAAESVETSKLANLSVTAPKLAVDAVEEAKIKNLAVTAAKLAAEAVTNEKVGALAITEAKLAAEAVGTGKIANLAVTAAKIAAEAVETAKIANLAVTTAKIAELAITSAKIAVNAVGAPQIGTLPQCRVRKTSKTEIVTKTNTYLTFPTELEDTDGMHSTEANTGRITCVTPGLYLFYGHIGWNVETMVSSAMWFRKTKKAGGTEIAGRQQADPGDKIENEEQSLSTSYPIRMVADDYVEVGAWIDGTGTLELAGEVPIPGGDGQQFGCVWISD